nr:hypothetical protein BgiMline_024659 [Biomphalaria glabrata]
MTIKKFKTIRFLLTKTVQGAHHERKITPYLYNLQVCIISTTSPEIRRKHQPSPHQSMELIEQNYFVSSVFNQVCNPTVISYNFVYLW